MSDDLVKRLREGRTTGSPLTWMVTPVHLEAADRIAELEADNARLREEVDALENIVRWLIDGLIRIRLGREAIFSDLKNLYSNDPLP